MFDIKIGKKKQVLRRGFKKKSEAQDFLTEIANQKNSYFDSKKLSLREFMEEWFEKTVQGKLAANTVRGYKVNIFKHIIPNIGKQQLSSKIYRDSIMTSSGMRTRKMRMRILKVRRKGC